MNISKIVSETLAAVLICGGCALGYYWNEVFPDETPPARTNLPTGTPIARTGEWVTNPDGTRVCKLVRDVRVGGFMNVSSCSDWVGEMPQFGQLVPYLRNNRGFGQIHVEGEWRP